VKRIGFLLVVTGTGCASVLGIDDIVYVTGSGGDGGSGTAGGGSAAGGTGSAGAPSCLGCAAAFKEEAPDPDLVCAGERDAYVSLRTCICGLTGQCPSCSSTCTSRAAATTDCLECVDGLDNCDAAGKKCGVPPF
jgi:hypothetical protein